MLTHSQKEGLVEIYAKLSSIRHVLADLRSSVFLVGVDKVTRDVAELQDQLEKVLCEGKLP